MLELFRKIFGCYHDPELDYDATQYNGVVATGSNNENWSTRGNFTILTEQTSGIINGDASTVRWFELESFDTETAYRYLIAGLSVLRVIHGGGNPEYGNVKRIIDRKVRSEWKNRVIFYKVEPDNAGSSIMKIGKPHPQPAKKKK